MRLRRGLVLAARQVLTSTFNHDYAVLRVLPGNEPIVHQASMVLGALYVNGCLCKWWDFSRDAVTFSVYTVISPDARPLNDFCSWNCG